MAKKNKHLTTIGLLFIILVFQLPFVNVFAQNKIPFSPNDTFDIPENNSTISFSSAGSYDLASLDNDVWNFVNFQLDDGFTLESFSVSAVDSNVMIQSLEVFDDNLGAFLTYTVVGDGEQTFNFGVIAIGGEWSVTFDDIFIAETSGWSLLEDNTLSITGATSNVTLFYFIFPDFTGDDSDKSFFDQHSVSITSTVTVLVVLVSSITVRYINHRISKKNE